MNYIHPTMQQALRSFGAPMQHFTVNPALSHPDSNSEPQAWPLDKAIAYALKVLKDPKADQFTRNYAAGELDAAWINNEEKA
jgi:hypothetical protein